MQQTINKWFVTCLETIIPLTFLSTPASILPLELGCDERTAVSKVRTEEGTDGHNQES